MLTAEQRAEAATALLAAETSRKPIRPLVRTHRGIDVTDAYEIQLLNIRRRLANGAKVLGHKVGLSSAAMQQMMGVTEPDYGHLLDDMRLSEDEAADASRYCQPRVEVEVAFLLGEDLSPDCTEEQVLARTAYLAPAIELIDSRIEDWRISLPDTVADNASSAAFVLGAARVPPKHLDVKGIWATLSRNGEVLAKGRSDAVLGNPATAVAWLAGKVAAFGVHLRAGDIVLPGSCTRAYDARPGDVFDAEFAGLGTVHLAFREGAA